MTELARGVYRYWRDGIQQTVHEPWQLSRSKHGLILRGQRLIDDRPALDVQAEYRASKCTAMQLRWRAPGQDVSLHYRHCGDALQWRFDDATDSQTLALPEGCLMFPLLRAASGPLLLQLAGAPQTVVLPSLHHPEDANRFLQPLLSVRHAEFLGDESDQGHHYRYYGGEYGDAGSDYWLNPRGLTRRYRWHSPQGIWEVRLEDVESAPGFSGFF